MDISPPVVLTLLVPLLRYLSGLVALGTRSRRRPGLRVPPKIQSLYVLWCSKGRPLEGSEDPGVSLWT